MGGVVGVGERARRSGLMGGWIGRGVWGWWVGRWAVS